MASPLIACLLALTFVGLAQVQGTLAAFTDTAGATSGPFSARKDFVPRIDQTVSGNNYVTCDDSIVPLPAHSTLTWRHLGGPYQYRVILRDLDGVERTSWNVVPNSTTAGSLVSVTVDGTGLDTHGAIWQYDAEVHTVLPGSGMVSAAWRGIGLFQDASSRGLRCSGRGAQEGYPDPSLPAPVGLTCTDQGSILNRSARLNWTNVSPYTYRVVVRHPITGNVLKVVTTNSAPATVDISLLEVLLGGTARAEVYTVKGAAVSTSFAAYTLNIALLGLTGVTCGSAVPTNSPNAALARGAAEPVAPTTTAVPTTTSPTGSPTEPAKPEPSRDAAAEEAKEAGVSKDVPLTSHISSSSGYRAQLVQSDVGAAVVVTVSGSEAFRTSASRNDTIEWVAGTDELRITGPTGTWSVSSESGVWAKSPVAPVTATQEPIEPEVVPTPTAAAPAPETTPTSTAPTETSPTGVNEP